MTITKTAQDNSPLANTEFKIYKTTAKDADLGDVAATKKTDKDGVAKFEDLDIYEAGYENSSAPKYQWYCIVETGSETGYSLNLSKYYFVIPTEGKYDLKCDYMNGRIFNPDTAGNAFDAIKYVGLGVIILSLVLGGLYLYNIKRYKCKRFAE